MRVVTLLLFLSYTLQACSQEKSSPQINNTVDSTLSPMYNKPSPGKLFLKAENAYQEGYYTKAVELCNQIIALDSSYIETFYLRGKAESNLGHHMKAIESFSIVLEYNPSYNDVYVSRGGVYYDIGNYPAALEDLSRAIKGNPSDRVAYYNRGIIYELLNQMEKACADWQKAADLGHQKAAIEVEKNCK
ncbi:MAG: tetratricopeptide repeat protein [Thermonemataceae bacterium]